MAIENIGSVYVTKVPGLTDNADIQEALKIYHYGSKNPPLTRNDVLAESTAGIIKAAEDRITSLESKGIGSVYASSEPTSVPNGFVWVKSDSAAISIANTQTSAFFSTSEPTGQLTAGMLWIDSDSNPLTMKVYDGDSWETVTSSGGPSFVPPTSYQLTLTGQDVASSSPGNPFMYMDGSTPTSFSVNVPVTTYSKNEITVSLGFGSTSMSALGPIRLVRVVNGNLLSPQIISSYYFEDNRSLCFTYIDDHSEPSGSIITYGLLNATSGDVTFSGLYTAQISAKEIA